MTKLEMAKEYQKKLREYRKRKEDELDREIGYMWSKLVLVGGGSLWLIGFFMGRLGKI